MKSYSKYKNLNNLRANTFIIGGHTLLSMIHNAILKGMMLSPEEKKMEAHELALKFIKKYSLQEINEQEINEKVKGE